MTGMVIATGTFLELAHLAGAQVNMNPTSKDFLQAKFGKTSFNIAGRNESYIKFAAQMITGVKTNADEIPRELGKGFGSETRLDLLINFLRDKLAPVAGAISDALASKDMFGEKFNVAGEGGQPANRTELFNKLMPITAQDFINMAMDDPDNLKAIIASPLAIFGVQMKTEAPNDWGNSGSKELAQFHQEVGNETFKEANEEYNKKVDEFHDSLQDDEEYRKMSDEEKERYVIDQKSDIKKDIFDEYNFTYERPEK